MSGYHPWRHLRSLEQVTLGWHDMPEADAVLFADIETILIRRGMLQAERRCALAHELAHHHLGHHGCADRTSLLRQELDAEVIAARWLIPLDDYVGARLWTTSEQEQADELWVDVRCLRARAESLTAQERAEVQARVRVAHEGWGA